MNDSDYIQELRKYIEELLKMIDELNARIKELEHVMGLDLEGREMK
jgi:hypothetical protein